MIKAVGTFSAALVITTMMAISTATAGVQDSGVVETRPPVPQIFRSSTLPEVATHHFLPAESDSAGDGSIWNSHSHKLRWQSLFMRSQRDVENTEMSTWLSARLATPRALRISRTYGSSAFDELKLIAPAFASWKKYFFEGLSASSHLKSILGDVDAAQLQDAAQFYALVNDLAWSPDIWAEEGEIVFEWIDGDRHAVVSFEGDSRIGYTLLKDGEFVSGADDEARPDAVPTDLLDYLTASA